jgi:hypothetical protein
LIIISKVAIVQWHLLNPKPNFKSYITPKWLLNVLMY